MIDHNKKITQSGGLTIPKDIRNALKLEAGKPINIKVTDEGDILLSTKQSCHVCANTKNLVVVKALPLCTDCVKLFSNRSNLIYGKQEKG